MFTESYQLTANDLEASDILWIARFYIIGRTFFPILHRIVIIFMRETMSHLDRSFQIHFTKIQDLHTCRLNNHTIILSSKRNLFRTTINT